MSNQGAPLKIAYSAGDPAAIGFEIFQKVQAQLKISNPLNIDLILVDDLESLTHIASLGHKPSALAGEHVYQSLKKAHHLALNSEVSFIITGPVSKNSLQLAGYPYSGQTEVLASLNQIPSSQVEMIFVYKDFRILLGTRHLPLREVPQAFMDRCSPAIEHAIQAAENLFKIKNPRIAVAGLNPHAGENGLLGLEEIELNKSIELVQAKYPQNLISKPLSADSLFAKAAQAVLGSRSPDYDVYVAAYHDQALALIKGISAYRAVNLSYGLPYLRLSVDHGTAFDIAGQNLASEEGLLACLDLAHSLKICEKAALIG